MNNVLSTENFFVSSPMILDFNNSELRSLDIYEMSSIDGGLENLPWWAYAISPVGALVTDYIIDKYNKGCNCH